MKLPRKHLVMCLVVFDNEQIVKPLECSRVIEAGNRGN